VSVYGVLPIALFGALGIAVLLRNVLPKPVARVLGAIAYLICGALAVAIAAFGIWALAGIRGAGSGWLILIGFYLLFAVGIFLVGRLIYRIFVGPDARSLDERGA
jgi:hypothetical protein